MLSSTIITSLILGLSQLSTGIALPSTPPPTPEPGFIINHVASDYFPNSKGDLSAFDVDVHYVGYSSATEAWLTSLDPHSATSDEEKARILTEAAYAKKYDENDADMAGDVESLLAHVAGNVTTTTAGIAKRSTFSTSAAHAVLWSACGTVFSCIAGTTCQFDLQINRAPRSRCEAQGGSNCCVSWSTYNVRAGFFSSTWTACNQEVQAEHKINASCEGFGTSDQGGDVCLSNRATGCT
ncbi:hypothetical protein DTO013E5_621 [Penicillium roqueforti]|uniref:uncharacterized protein n=1 Tax=Penicillium roqueforti TaxID=5082 RepID=UPI00190979F2|nr:uncharacterized protein LCP9604111_518 [Penicillium roqueforti]KAF9252992.1 hypothetical protein LCP9604111_518 [Penicillium roqueforti]KAI1838507.1 hypothetical protein CBS147337_232 [Penicillium roqueforti]KAI2680578.1 hypothetical protein CBS147355_3558 [Penicillium roqueforti]KAI2691033.1 hypothetical protein LCP963914a_1234 [Penicillium roqueforti]KAI2706999.1 hypothetical protein CBS147372_910 [Penicillium roqueforti]